MAQVMRKQSNQSSIKKFTENQQQASKQISQHAALH